MFGTGTGTATGTGRSTGTGIATCVPTRVGGSVTRAGTTGAGAGAGALPIVSVGAGADTTGAITGEARSGNGMGGTRSGEEGKLNMYIEIQVSKLKERKKIRTEENIHHYVHILLALSSLS